ncbi:MAG: MerR family transcriptional regulator [Pseudomonadota bacterium]|nr:MerR family transcriptional regulator [Pseudomonadota bacterium]MEC8234342.1 MerR family transcriptional regulator [Pseudomonadota bacterium]MEC8752040.1 MerR family transcriptional regulator [Pseudomonadota bacterium]MED5301288.1 MerR family transcriptional regulator [Pseudomonadota bacterium]MEE3007076.1 MerR family transcriptional regulator [Pseudomonadota bacterium]|tara:strand:- start:407 stop:850 length:444 start_codon:yes stop_codon:yes gene_type:complete
MAFGTDNLTGSRRGGKSPGAFRTISEVSNDLEVPPHVLRFWETKFPQIKPLKRGGGRRYYRPEDVALLRQIRQLLYNDGYTIKGVQRLIKEGALKNTAQLGVATAMEPDQQQQPQNSTTGSREKAALRSIVDELQSLRKLVSTILDK